MGYLRCGSRGILLLVPIQGAGTCEKNLSWWNNQFSIYVPMYSTCLPMYLSTYVPIIYYSWLYLLVNYLRRSSNVLTYLLTYKHSYVTTYIPKCLCTFIPMYLYYLHTTNIPTYLSYIRAYLLANLHTYLPYLSTSRNRLQRHLSQ